jgi:hypothetical protein
MVIYRSVPELGIRKVAERHHRVIYANPTLAYAFE